MDHLVLHCDSLPLHAAFSLHHMDLLHAHRQSVEPRDPRSLLGRLRHGQLRHLQRGVVRSGRLLPRAHSMDTDLGAADAHTREDRCRYCNEHGFAVRYSPSPRRTSKHQILIFLPPHRAGVCAIVKGVYVIQLRQGDFSYNGKDVTIWTAVETAVAIIGASIPVLRVFFREKVSSYSNSRGHRSLAPSTLKHIPTANGTARRSIALTAIGGGGQKDAFGKEGIWTRIEPLEDRGADAGSERSLTGRGSDEEIGIAISGDTQHDGIWQTTTITREVERRGRRRAGSHGEHGSSFESAGGRGYSGDKGSPPSSRDSDTASETDRRGKSWLN